MNKEQRKSMNKVAKDIILYRFRPGMTLKQVEQGFFSLMRKHGIKEGHREPGSAGRSLCNFEWTMCRDMYYARVHDWFTFRSLLFRTPKDLECYEEKE